MYFSPGELPRPVAEKGPQVVPQLPQVVPSHGAKGGWREVVVRQALYSIQFRFIIQGCPTVKQNAL